MLRQGKRIRQFDKAFGTKLIDRIQSGELKKIYQAIRIMGSVLAHWESLGEPEQYDASWANKLNGRDCKKGRTTW